MDQLRFLAVGFFSCEGSRARCRNGVEHYDGRDARAARSLHHIGHFDVSCHRRNAGGEVNLVLLFVVIGSVDLNIMCFFNGIDHVSCIFKAGHALLFVCVTEIDFCHNSIGYFFSNCRLYDLQRRLFCLNNVFLFCFFRCMNT